MPSFPKECAVNPDSSATSCLQYIKTVVNLYLQITHSIHLDVLDSCGVNGIYLTPINYLIIYLLMQSLIQE